MTSEQPGYPVIVTRVFDVPIAQLWQAWIDPETMQRWWGPTDFDCSIAQMNVREGGSSLVCLRTPGNAGGTFCTLWTYEHIVPTERIEFIQYFTDSEGHRLAPVTLNLPADIPESIQVVITFHALGQDTTEMTIAEHSYATKHACDRSQVGLAQSLDKLAAIFAARSRAKGEA